MKKSWWKALTLSLTCLSLNSALAVGGWPVSGSERAQAWLLAGGSVTIKAAAIPKLDAHTQAKGWLVQPTPVAGQLRLVAPANAPVGRVDLGFQGGTRLAVQVLAQSTLMAGQVQVLVNPKRSRAELERAIAPIGKVAAWEGLQDRSPCGFVLATVGLNSGVSVESALNFLSGLDPDLVWYPDPIAGWGSPSGVAQRTIAPTAKALGSFGYASGGAGQGLALRPTLGQAGSGNSGAGVTIAVLDTGFSPALDINHELTAPNDPRVRFANRVRPAVNAMIPLTDPNYAQLSAQAADFWEGHGTQVAILAAGSQSGVASGAWVQTVKVCGEGEGKASCNTKDVLRGICLALGSAPPEKLVLNLSLGGLAPTQGIHAALKWATDGGVVAAAAGGNKGLLGNPREYPAAFTEGVGSQVALPLLAVASATPKAMSAGGGKGGQSSQMLWGYSNFSTLGSYLTISALGEGINIGQPYLYSGTSFATPLVAGAAALELQHRTTQTTPAIVSSILGKSANVAGIKPLLRLNNF
ncbi:hypothetical protein Dxin01_03192 [Deinococcus xinjiangensis]|uniref:Peptidase S8/S53 domain-containing protein n=1 Tax=Deinococcus xinjiangensis TaxID=457454 RepID=A0ABP9VDX0_9DEIO